MNCYLLKSSIPAEPHEPHLLGGLKTLHNALEQLAAITARVLNFYQRQNHSTDTLALDGTEIQLSNQMVFFNWVFPPLLGCPIPLLLQGYRLLFEFSLDGAVPVILDGVVGSPLKELAD